MHLLWEIHEQVFEGLVGSSSGVEMRRFRDFAGSYTTLLRAKFQVSYSPGAV